MKRVISILILLGFVWINQADAQIRLIGERAIFTHHYVHPVLINPGATGFYNRQQLFFNYRNSWATFEDSPKTVTFSYDGPIGNRLGFGAIFIKDDFASLETTKGQLALSYSIQSDNNKVGFGLTTEFVQHSLSSDQLGNPLLDNNDILIQQALDGTQYFDASFGIYGMYDNHLVYGLTLPSLISAKISEDTGTSEVDRDFGYIINLGYIFDVKDYDLKIEPSIYVKQLMLTPFHVDVNLKMDFLEDKLTGGLSYTVGADKRFGFLVGARVNKFGFYYSYNVSFHDFQQYNNGSHEFSFKLDLTREDQVSTLNQ
jgi:type IX secretion system PorP/SprF family membrane protein